MTPSLRELQAGIARAVLAGDTSVATCVLADGIDPARRLGIHANHYRLSLVEALGATFMAPRRLVGDEFFDGLARRYVVAHPPGGPCLFEYGADFAAFCAADAAAAATPFLPDVIEFAFALNRAAHAPAAPVLDSVALAMIDAARLADLRVEPRPGVTLIASRFPLPALWRLATDESADAAPVDLAAGPEQVVIWPEADGPAWTQLDAADHAFLAAMAAGRPLGEAASAATEIDPMFHLAGALGLALRHGLLGQPQKLETTR
jgi:hypothetical protein